MYLVVINPERVAAGDGRVVVVAVELLGRQIHALQEEDSAEAEAAEKRMLA